MERNREDVMKNDSQWFERYFVPGQREYIRNRRIKAFLTGFVIAAFIFTGLGYSYRMRQVDGSHKDQILKLNAQILDMRDRLAAKEGNRPVKIIVQGKKP